LLVEVTTETSSVMTAAKAAALVSPAAVVVVVRLRSSVPEPTARLEAALPEGLGDSMVPEGRVEVLGGITEQRVRTGLVKVQVAGRRAREGRRKALASLVLWSSLGSVNGRANS
jgi:hypothetical protein